MKLHNKVKASALLYGAVTLNLRMAACLSHNGAAAAATRSLNECRAPSPRAAADGRVSPILYMLMGNLSREGL